MNETFDEKRVQAAVAELITALGGDLSQPGMANTPARAAKMYAELYAGQAMSNEAIAAAHGTTFADPGTDLVLVRDVGLFSFCEHHFALMYNMKAHVAYIPRGRVIGLSKVARIVDLVSKRFQLQERIGRDIADILAQVLGADDIMVVLEGEHSCMTARGIKAQGALTRTCTLRGRFVQESGLRQEVLAQL